MKPNTGDWSASVDVLGQFFYILLIFAIVILLFLICARWLALIRNAGGKSIRVIESCSVAPHSSVQVLQAGERIFLIGVTKEHISFLTEITGEAINITAKPNPALFEKYLKRYISPEGPDKKEDGT